MSDFIDSLVQSRKNGDYMYQQGRADERERIMSIVIRCIAHNVYNVIEGKNLLDEIREEIVRGGE